MIPTRGKNKKDGRLRSVRMFVIGNKILYRRRLGCHWRMLPYDLTRKGSVYDYFARWHGDGTMQKTNETGVWTIRQIEAVSKEIDPSAASIGRKTVKPSERSGSRRYDGVKKITRRERRISVDMVDLLLAVLVSIGSTYDAYGARPVVKQLSQSRQPRLSITYANSKHHNRALRDAICRQKNLTWELEAIRRPIGVKHFALLPSRWVAEQTFSRPARPRRPSRYHEHRIESSDAMVHDASIKHTPRRLVPSGDQLQFKYRLLA